MSSIQQRPPGFLFNVRTVLSAGLVGIIGLALPACSGADGTGGAEEEQTGTVQSEILNGTQPSTWGTGIVAVIGTFSGRGTQRCTGTFINRFDVLTAAHCVKTADGLRASKIEIAFGATWDGTRHTADRYVSLPAWSSASTTENDIAMVSFNTAIAPSGSAMPVADFNMPAGSYEGTRVVIAGYGMSTSDRASAGAKRWAYAKVTKNLGYELHVLGESGTGTCDGDSGGPIVRWDGSQWVVVGVISASGSSGCTTASTTFGSMPTHQLKFINANLSIGVIVLP